MTLRELQLHFANALLRGEATPLQGAVRSDERADASTRVDVYRTMYRLRLLEVLGEVYPRTRERLGAAWDEVAERYVRRHPSRTPSLRQYGDKLPTLLDEVSASLAQLEWTLYDLFDALDEPPLTREQLATPEGASMPLQRIAASTMLTTPYDAHALWEGDESAEAAAPTALIVWREDLTVYHRRVDAEEAQMLALVDGTYSLSELCERFAEGRSIDEAAQLVFAHVGRWVADGLLT